MDNGRQSDLEYLPKHRCHCRIRVMTSNYGAQYGRNGSGTNRGCDQIWNERLHGDVFEFARNEVFNARNYFDGVTKPPYKRHDYGYTLGGPVFIPRHYNARKDETFSSSREEWRRESQSNTFDVKVPSLGERYGNFPMFVPADPASFARIVFLMSHRSQYWSAVSEQSAKHRSNGALLLPLIRPRLQVVGRFPSSRASRSTPPVARGILPWIINIIPS